MAVNADEGEPGTFKDRYYLETDPHRFIEGMLIAAWAVEASRHLHLSARRIPAMPRDPDREIAAAEAAGLAPHTKIHLRRGAGAYICGEESAMLESIEGKRGLPRHKPPFPSQVGLFGRPTLINNVETLFWVRDIVEKGPDWFTGQGRNGRKGLRTFSVSGRVKNPGVKLAPAGITARELIDEFAAAWRTATVSRAICRAAPRAASCRPSKADIPLDFGTLEARAALSARRAVVVLSDQDDMKDGGAQPDALLRGRELRPVHAVPGRHREGGQADEPRRAGTRRCSTI